MTLAVPDDLRAAVEPLLPPDPPKPRGGRPRAADRVALAGILSVLRTGIQGHELPRELGCCGETCWRRLRDWHAAGVRAALHRAPLERLHGAGQLDWGRAALDGAGVPAKRGARRPAPTRRTGAGRAPSATSSWTPAARRSAWPWAGPTATTARRSPRRRPRKLHADKGCGHRRCRRECRARGVQPRLARRGVDGGERLGRHRWVVERTLAWLARSRRLTVRYERRADIHLALTTLACAVICLRQVRRFCP
jgi:transposase